jgi:hypothetical protein
VTDLNAHPTETAIIGMLSRIICQEVKSTELELDGLSLPGDMVLTILLAQEAAQMWTEEIKNRT